MPTRVPRIKLNCKNCGNDIFQTRQRIEKQGLGKFCNKKCQFEFVKKQRTKFVCRHCKEDFYISASRTKGHKQRIYCSKKCFDLIRKGKKISKEIVARRKPSRYWLGRKRPMMSGPNHYLWKGGVSPANEKIRKSLEYTEWRRDVFERDNYTCQFCGERGGRIHAHHIRPFALFPTLRFDVPNGITLCENCHKTTPTFGQNSKDIFSKIISKNHD